VIKRSYLKVLNKKILIPVIAIILIAIIYPSISLCKTDYKEEYEKAINHYYELLATARSSGYDTTEAEGLREQAEVTKKEGFIRAAFMLIEEANKKLEEKLQGQPDFVMPTSAPSELTAVTPVQKPTANQKPVETPTVTQKPTETPTVTQKPTETPISAATVTPTPEETNISSSFDRNEGALFGINSVHQPIFNELIPYYKKTGGKWIILNGLYWAKKKPPTWSKIDEQINSIYNSGFSIIIEINIEAKEQGGAAEFPSSPEDYSKFMFRCAARYDGDGDYNNDGISDGPALPKINYWKILNEPNLNRYWEDTPANYAKLIRLSSENVRKANPDGKIIFGGISNKNIIIDEKANTTFLDNLFKFTFPDGKKIQNYLDYMNFHYHGTSRGMDEFLQNQMEIMKKYNVKKPFIMGEIGCPGGIKFSFEEGQTINASLENQAIEMVKMFVTALARGAEKIVYLSISDQKKQLKDSLSNDTIFVSDETAEDIYQHDILSYDGLYYFDFDAKPAMFCYKVLAEKLRNRKISHELLGVAEGVRCFIFVKNRDFLSSDDTPLYVLWNETDKKQNISLNLPWQKAKLTSFVLLQGEEIFTSGLEPQGGNFDIHLSKEPVLIEFAP
ncbi:MAG: hypothetical protein ABRQ39_16490, partial [Candidatus Eremiobacterota bacterium]